MVFGLFKRFTHRTWSVKRPAALPVTEPMRRLLVNTEWDQGADEVIDTIKEVTVTSRTKSRTPSPQTATYINRDPIITARTEKVSAEHTVTKPGVN
ncbi:hypothetical protein EYF80_047167 [Liparis tanakae]|uniref:Uncharacterized protein n=1 Tax=Liparis tanakae TaxID=230148 RepID=A0A4Z2FNM5_9TELE|nr:hypothetical protein EYF80_047167 [Liparis tanakae]